MKKSSEAEQILTLIEELKEENLLVIVEGPKDKTALEKQGLSNIITLSKKPIYAVIEEAAQKTKEAAILTDLDKQGKKLYHGLAEGLQKHGVVINNKLRHALLKTRISHIEGLNTYLNSHIQS